MPTDNFLQLFLSGLTASSKGGIYQAPFQVCNPDIAVAPSGSSRNRRQPHSLGRLPPHFSMQVAIATTLTVEAGFIIKLKKYILLMKIMIEW
ncbi:hypothetical protein JNB11_05985 [Kocuria palustris]|nr:hypothetical protein [Kocuria palustris]